jgi:ribonucleoside-diphosphate reductase alpha chain
LAEHVTIGDDGNAQVDWLLLERTVRESTHFLDNVVSANAYVPAVPQLRNAALRARRIGLGIMGLGDMMYKLGVRYGGDDGQCLASSVMEFVRFHCMAYSNELTFRRGKFLAFDGSIYDFQYDAGANNWQVPQRTIPIRDHWNRPSLGWPALKSAIRSFGIRNAAQTTIAPTGTIATVVGCEGYGCEPVFALGYVRHFKDGDKDVELTYTSPLFQAELDRLVAVGHLTEQRSKEIAHHVALHGSCQDIADLPVHTRNTFVVSSDITAEEHVRMQAALQEFVDNSLSKTCNFPEGATEDDVAEAYMLAWELGCKGLTVYVTGSRETVVLETKATKDKKTQPSVPVPVVNVPEKQPRPAILAGHTYKKETPIGTAYITVNEHNSNPFEVFLNVGKAGSEVAAVSEAMGRLISYALRVPSSVTPQARLESIIDELIEIGGSRPLGFGNNRVRSLPDGVAQVLRNHMQGAAVAAEQLTLPIAQRSIGDICPECGEASFLNIEGCRKCAACGYSEC